MLQTDTPPLSAQHLRAKTVEGEDGLTLLLTDGEQDIEISHEIGNNADAANHLLVVAAVIQAHAGRIRYQDQSWPAECGPHNGP